MTQSETAMMREWLDSLAESARPPAERVYEYIETTALQAFEAKDPTLLATTAEIASALDIQQNTVQTCVARLRQAERVRVAWREGRRCFLAPGGDA